MVIYQTFNCNLLYLQWSGCWSSILHKIHSMQLVVKKLSYTFSMIYPHFIKIVLLDEEKLNFLKIVSRFIFPFSLINSTWNFWKDSKWVMNDFCMFRRYYCFNVWKTCAVFENKIFQLCLFWNINTSFSKLLFKLARKLIKGLLQKTPSKQLIVKLFC